MREAMKRCAGCENVFTPKKVDRVTYCSRACAFLFKTMRRVYPVKAEPSKALPKHGRARMCRVCSQQFIRPTSTLGRAVPHQVCSADCAVAVSRETRRRARHSPNGRAARALIKARYRKAIKGKRFDPFEVFERDGWTCQACCAPTPATLRGTWHPQAPELDHRVPLSRGGEHTKENTQTLCRQCNNEKGDVAA
jgi:5-methylcytosine-specific restriction endonuclease McrA